MDVRDYEYVVAIAEQGSISRAAAHLFITQSALTKFLQRTERQLGIALFYRDGNRFQLTEAGARYVETGRAILHLDQQLTEQLSEELASQKERIRFGFSMGWTDDILQNILPAFYERYPEIHVYAMGDTSRKHFMALQNHDLDLVLVTNVEQVPGYRYIPVDQVQMVLAVPEDSPLLEGCAVRADSPWPVIGKERLEGIPMVSMPRSTNSGRLARELCGSFGIHPNMVLEVSDVRTLIDAVAQGYGAAMLISAPLCGKKVRYLAIDGVNVEQTVMLVCREDKNLSPAMKYLMELLIKRKG